MNVAVRQDVIDARESAPASIIPSRTVARIEIFDSLEAAYPAWLQLEAAGALMTPYQRFDWIALWHQHVSGPCGIEPVIIVGRDALGAPVFLLPLARRRKGPLSIACFFGGRHANLNAGLWRRDVATAMTETELRAILTEAAASRGIDLLRLMSQPAQINGVANPLALIPHQQTPDDVFAATLSGGTGDEVLRACLSSSMRGRLRTKERKLQELPGYRYMIAATAGDSMRYLDAFLAQKAAQLAAQGISNIFDDDQVVAFLRAACVHGLDTGKPVIELHALECDAEVIAVFGGVSDGRRLSCMINAYTNSEAGRWSPGLVLMTHLISHCGDAGIPTIDLGAGYAQYKTFFCKEQEHTFDTILGVSPLGRMAAPAVTTSLRMKRWIKATPILWSATKLARKLLNRQ